MPPNMDTSIPSLKRLADKFASKEDAFETLGNIFAYNTEDNTVHPVKERMRDTFSQNESDALAYLHHEHGIKFSWTPHAGEAS